MCFLESLRTSASEKRTIGSMTAAGWRWPGWTVRIHGDFETVLYGRHYIWIIGDMFGIAKYFNSFTYIIDKVFNSHMGLKYQHKNLEESHCKRLLLLLFFESTHTCLLTRLYNVRYSHKETHFTVKITFISDL